MDSNKFIRSVAFAVFFLAVLACAQGRIVDTVYVDKHKVTYVIDTSAAAPNVVAGDSGSLVPFELMPKDSLGISAPPDTRNRVTLGILAQNLSFVLSYERMLFDFWGVAVDLSYDKIKPADVRSLTDADGTIATYSVPVSLRWYYGRRNVGVYHYTDSHGGMEQEKKQVECALQLQAMPVIYDVDLALDSNYRHRSADIQGKEFGLAVSLGMVGRFVYERFFWGSELALGRFIEKPGFRSKISVDGRSINETYLLNNFFLKAMLMVGFVF